MQNRTLIYSTAHQHQAQILKDRLEAEGINVLILNQQDSMYQTFGYIELYVLNEDIDKAKTIVDSIEK